MEKYQIVFESTADYNRVKNELTPICQTKGYCIDCNNEYDNIFTFGVPVQIVFEQLTKCKNKTYIYHL